MFRGVLAGLTAPRDGVPVGLVPYVDVPDVDLFEYYRRETAP